MNEPIAIGVTEAARLLGLEDRDVIELLEAGDLVGRRVRLRWVVSRRALEDWINRGETGHDSGASLLTIEQAARELRISRSAAYRLVQNGEIRTTKIGPRLTRVRREDLLAFVERVAS